MRMKHQLRSASLLAVTLLAIASFSGKAQAATYKFSFTSDGDIASTVFSPFTDVGGTVEGTIVLPDGDGTFLPTSLLIESYSPAHGTDINTNLLATSWATRVGTGFTVLGGVITNAEWAAQTGSANPDPMLGFDQIRFNYPNLNSFTLTGNPGQVTVNNDGFAGVTYTLVPEPSSGLLAASGALAALSFRNRRKA